MAVHRQIVVIYPNGCSGDGRRSAFKLMMCHRGTAVKWRVNPLSRTVTSAALGALAPPGQRPFRGSVSGPRRALPSAILCHRNVNCTTVTAVLLLRWQNFCKR